MAKEKEKRIAKELYLGGKTQKEIAKIVGVQEKTISIWVNKFGWKVLRDAQLSKADNNIDNIKKIISDIADETFAVNLKINKETDPEERKELRKYRNQLADEAAKWNKALENLDKQNKISFAIYLQVFEDIFNSLRLYDQKLFLKTLDFQEEHIQQKAIQYQ